MTRTCVLRVDLPDALAAWAEAQNGFTLAPAIGAALTTLLVERLAQQERSAKYYSERCDALQAERVAAK